MCLYEVLFNLMYNDIKPRAQTSPPPSEPTDPAPVPSRPLKSKPRKSKRFENWRSALSTIAVLLLAPLFALALTAYVFQSYQVDGPSMEPTLHHNDRLIVWKMPRTWARLTGHLYTPARGEIVIFTEPRLGQWGQTPGKQLIKRVVALPGERIVIQDGTLTVYNDEHPEGFRPDADPEGHTAGATTGDLDTTVPPDHIFVVGDNRTNSLDSRSFGPVHVDNIVGELAARILPLDKARRF
jgi:signal peptidase I